MRHLIVRDRGLFQALVLRRSKWMTIKLKTASWRWLTALLGKRAMPQSGFELDGFTSSALI